MILLDQEVANSLLSEVPSEVFDAILPLSNKNSQVIFIAILKNEQMRFGQIKELFRVTNSEEINYPLKSLVKSGLVAKKAEFLEDIGEFEKAVYCSTYLGKSVMRSLYKGVMIGVDGIPITQSQIISIGLSGRIPTIYSPSFIGEKPSRILPNKIEKPEIPLTISGGSS
jgi:DNA-binding HxlR family transcriptional regulator